VNFKALSKKEESIAEKIVDAAYTVHKILGLGLLEKVYEVCFCHELSKRGLKYQRQVDIPANVLVFSSILTCLLLKTVSRELYYDLGVLVPLWQTITVF